jgi:hypothetical protein
MAKPNNAAASILAAQPDASEPLATSAPEDSPGKAPTKPAQPIGPAPVSCSPLRYRKSTKSHQSNFTTTF